MSFEPTFGFGGFQFIEGCAQTAIKNHANTWLKWQAIYGATIAEQVSESDLKNKICTLSPLFTQTS